MKKTSLSAVNCVVVFVAAFTAATATAVAIDIATAICSCCCGCYCSYCTVCISPSNRVSVKSLSVFTFPLC